MSQSPEKSVMLNFLNQLGHRLPPAEVFSDAMFWLYFLAILIAVRSMPLRSRLSNFVLLAGNLCILLALPRFTGVGLLIYVALAAVTYGIGKRLTQTDTRIKKGTRLGLAVFGIVTVLFVLASFKYQRLQALVVMDTSIFGQGAGGFFFLIGISYVSFKAMHFVIESYKGTIKNPHFLDVLNFLLFFPSFVSGPINRYNDFYETSARSRQSRFRDDVRPGLERIIHGLFKKFVVTVILFPYTLFQLKTPLGDLTTWQILLGLYAYAIYFYFDFSGYTDLAIGSARLLGFHLPENFSLPFLKKNIQQLWANWHMSLTGWLTDYVYWPLVRKMRANETLRKNPLVISNIAIIFTFLLCGAWHGERINFVLWGLYHGVGIAVVNVYQKWKRQVRNPWVIRYFGSSLSYSWGVLLTFNFFALGLLFFFDADAIAIVLRRLFWNVKL